MNIFETIGMAWVILTSALATIAIFYLAYIALRSAARRTETDDNPLKVVKEMFKLAR